MKRIAIVMGSDSDLPIAERAAEVLKKLAVPFVVRVMSAHREAGFGAVIAIAGKAAHLAGFIAAQTRLPVIGVPVRSADLGGLDALLATVQMPSGVPVATVAIDGGANAAWLAVRILAVSDEELAASLDREAASMAEGVKHKDRALQAGSGEAR